MPRVVLLQGRPGGGKTLTALTAPKNPKILIDIDRKAKATDIIKPMIEAGTVIVREISSPLVDGRMDHRARDISTNKKPSIQPTGWVDFATLVESIFNEADKFKKPPGGTLIIDSWTQLTDHLKRFIIYHDNRGFATFSDRNWGTYLNINTEAIVSLKDSCARWDMDLIITVHERVSDIPTPRTQSKRVLSADGQSRREYEGEMQSVISPSIEGQFGIQMPAYFAEVYHCFVEVDRDENPTWRMRIKPDQVRSLRTSIDTKELVVEPNLEKLWKS